MNEMPKNARHDLQRLDRFNRWLVVFYWRRLLWGQVFKRTPLPGRVAVIHSVLLLFCLTALPDASKLPHLFLPILWSALFSVSLSLSILFPLRQEACHMAK